VTTRHCGDTNTEALCLFPSELWGVALVIGVLVYSFLIRFPSSLLVASWCSRGFRLQEYLRDLLNSSALFGCEKVLERVGWSLWRNKVVWCQWWHQPCGNWGSRNPFFLVHKIETRCSKNGLAFVCPSYLPPFPMARAVDGIWIGFFLCSRAPRATVKRLNGGSQDTSVRWIERRP
jgi:hypothetical protein